MSLIICLTFSLSFFFFWQIKGRVVTRNKDNKSHSRVVVMTKISPQAIRKTTFIAYLTALKNSIKDRYALVL